MLHPPRTFRLAMLAVSMATFALAGCKSDFLAPEDTSGGTSSGGTTASGGTTSSGGNGEGGATTGGTNGSACSTECTDETPLCHEDSGNCVECLEETDCEDAFCDLDSHACVECLDSSHCTDADAARCDAGECTGCTSHDDCAGIAGKEACNDDTGECVECTPDTEQDHCETKSCNPATFTCGPHDRNSRGTCRSCISDSDCQTNHRCVPMDYPTGTPREGGYCLRIAPPCNTRPYTVPFVDRTSLSGVTGSSYCGINEDLATCEAVRALESDWHCNPTSPGDGFCWPPDQSSAEAVQVPGALCRTVGLTENRCTYECELASRCPSTLTCSSPTSEEPQYCGGPSD